jgi:hypothetical protein
VVECFNIAVVVKLVERFRPTALSCNFSHVEPVGTVRIGFGCGWEIGYYLGYNFFGARNAQIVKLAASKTILPSHR